MREREQIIHLEAEIEAVIQRFRMEYSLTVASAIGVLYLAAHKLAKSATEEDDDDGRTSESK